MQSLRRFKNITQLMKPRSIFLLQFFLVSLLFFVTGSYRNWPYKIESDGKYYYQYLISVWYDGDIDFANNYRVPRKPFMKTDIDHYDFKDQLSPTGHPINMFTTGPAVLWLPFFTVASSLGWIINQTGWWAIPLDGWSLFFQYLVMYSAVIYATITLILMYRLLRDYFSEYVALLSASLVFWSTNWLYYSVFEVSMSHVYDLFTLVAFLWLLLKAFNSNRTTFFMLAGLMAGLHVLVRTQNVLTVFLLLGYYGIWFKVSAPTKLNVTGKGMVSFGAVFILTLLPLISSNLYLYGHIFAVPQGTEFLDFFQPQFYGVLFSGRNGLFSHHPVLLLGVVGIGLHYFHYQREKNCLQKYVIPLSMVFLLQLYVNAAAADWWGGHAFGQRRMMSSLLLFSFGIAYLQKYLYQWSPKTKPVFAALAIVFALANGYLIVIHLFAWSYDQSHNILDWMFIKAPLLIFN